MASLVGQSFPEDVSFMHVPFVDGKGVNEMCGLPQKYDASKGTVITTPPPLCPTNNKHKHSPNPTLLFSRTSYDIRNQAHICALHPTRTEFKNKKVALVAVPGAFTPTCSEKHVPTFIEEKEALKAKGIDQVVVIAYNDAFVMSAWGKANGVKDDFIVSPPTVTDKKRRGWLVNTGLWQRERGHPG